MRGSAFIIASDSVDRLALPVVLNRPEGHNETPLFHELEVQGDAHTVH